MPTHVHFHDFLSDAKPFEEAKHKRSHGKFAKMAGGGAEQKNPGLKETKQPKPVSAHARPKPQPQSRLATWGKQAQEIKSGAAARVAAAVQAAKGQASALGKEAFAVPHDVQTLTKGFDTPNTPLRQKMGVQLAKNVGNYLAEMGKEIPETLYHAGAGLKSMAQGVPMTDHQSQAWKTIGYKVVISATMRALDLHIPGAGLAAEAAGHAVGHAIAGLVGGHAIDHVTQHVIQTVAEEVVDHAAEEHQLKLMGGVGRVGQHLFGRQRRLQQQQQMSQGGDSVFRDQQIDPQTMKLLEDWLNTVAKSLVNAPIDMKKIMASVPKQNGDSRFGPMFGGLKSSGNRLTGDEGTSEGAAKGWLARRGKLQARGRRTKPAKPQVRKAETPTPPPAPAAKPTFEEMRAKRDYIPPPAAKPHKQAERKAPVAPPPTQRKGQAPPGLGYKTQQPFFAQGEHRSTKSKATQAGARPTREQVSMTQREREAPGREHEASTAQTQRAELRSLQARKGSLTEKEQRRMQSLLREHGGGGAGAPTARGTQAPPALKLRTRGGRRWLGRS